MRVVLMREDASEREARSSMLPREWRWGLSDLFAGELCGDDTGLLLVLEPVALALAVDGGRVVQQPVEDGRSDDVVGEDGGPVAAAYCCSGHRASARRISRSRSAPRPSSQGGYGLGSQRSVHSRLP